MTVFPEGKHDRSRRLPEAPPAATLTVAAGVSRGLEKLQRKWRLISFASLR